MNSSEIPRDIVLFGTGKSAEVLAYYIERQDGLTIAGYTVDAEFMDTTEFRGKPVVAWEDIEDNFPPGNFALIGPPTYKRMNGFRRDRYYEGKARGYRFASFIHENNAINTEEIGDHCIILENNVIEPFTSIGENVVIWSHNTIGHHTSIGDHTFLSAQVGISGHCQIGKECFFSGKAGIAHGVRIGDRCAVLNAAGVNADLPDGTVINGYAGKIRTFTSERISHLF